jgi:hypothetical protein
LGDVRGHLPQSSLITPLKMVEHGLQLLAHLTRKHSSSVDFPENLFHNQPKYTNKSREGDGSFQKRMEFFLP